MSNENKKISYSPLSGKTVIEWRERMGYTKTDACEQLGCSRPALDSWESGATQVPRYIGLACAALALGMKPYGAVSEEDAA